MARRQRAASRAPLACPACALTYPLDERFCERCGTPLVYTGAETIERATTDAHDRARKIKGEYSRGDLVRVAGGRNQAEAELIQNLLIEEGVPSTLRRSAGFDVPDFLAAGPRDVLVPESGAEAAHSVLLDAEMVESGAATIRHNPSPLRVLAAVVAGGALAAGIAWALIQAAG